MKKYLIILICMLLIAFSAIGLFACGGTDNNPGGGGVIAPSAWTHYSDNIKYNLSYTSEEECPGGNIKDDKLHESLDFELDTVYYMIVDFAVSTFNAEKWRDRFGAMVKMAPATIVSATLQEANTGIVSEMVESNITKITTTYNAPENKDEAKDYRFTVKFVLKSDCLLNIGLLFFGDGELADDVVMKEYSFEKNVTAGLAYELNRDKKSYSVVSKGTAIDRDIIVPSYYWGLPVSAIHRDAFKQCSSLNSIVIPDGIESIGWNAFSGCSGLTSITIPDSVTTIENGVFSDCSGLESITIPFVGRTKSNNIHTNFGYIFGATTYSGNPTNVPTSLKTVVITDGIEIGSHAFYGCNEIISVTMLDSVTTIGDSAFYNCGNLTNITIPDSVTTIGDSAFYGTAYYDDPKNWENNVLYIDNHLIAANKKISGGYSVAPGTKTIAASAFEGCRSLTSITIPDSVTSIDIFAFCDCSGLTRINLPSSLTKIGYYAFYGCSNLSSIGIPDSVTSIGFSAFYGTAYYADPKNWENNVLYIGNHLIAANTEIVGGYSVAPGTKTIAASAFYGCDDLTSITIPDSVTAIGSSAFNGCIGLTSITIPDSVTEIGGGAFEGCSGLASITISDFVTGIGGHTFKDCSSLTNIIIPNNVTSIGDYAFYNCSSLTNIIIPNNVTSIGSEAFCDCISLESVVFENKSTWEVVFESVNVRVYNTIKSDDLANPSTAVKLLTDTYHRYRWYLR